MKNKKSIVVSLSGSGKPDFRKIRILESSETDGKVWDVVLMEVGLSQNGKFYPREVLQKAIPLFEGAKSYAYQFNGDEYNHLPEKARRENPNGFTKNLVGFFDSVRFSKFKDDDGQMKEGLVAKFHVADLGLRRVLKMAWERGKSILGLSIDGDGRTSKTPGGLERVNEILSIDSIDPVTHPAAGGRFVRLVASKNLRNGGYEEMDFMKKLFEMLKLAKPELVEGIDVENITEAQEYTLMASGIEHLDFAKIEESFSSDMLEKILDLVKGEKTEEAVKMIRDLKAKMSQVAEKKKPTEEELKAAEKKKNDDELAEAKKKEDELKAGKDGDKGVKEALGGVQETLKKMQEKLDLQERMQLVEQKLTEAKLPSFLRDQAATLIRESKVTDIEVIGKIIDTVKETSARLHESELDIGSMRQVGKTEREKLVKAMDGFFDNADVDGVGRFKSFHEAYETISGKRFREAREVLKDASIYSEDQKESASRVRESLQTSDFGDILGDSVTRKMIKEYKADNLQDWRKIVSDIVPIKDFRTNRRMLMGGYGNLPTVAERGNYLPLTSPGDDENTYSIAKKGGTEDITFEMVANDDVGAIRRIPRKLGRAAGLTLYQDVFNIPKNNVATAYDGVVLFDNAHSNLGTTALGDAGLSAVKKAMMKQAMYGSSTDILGMANNPKNILVPTDLENMAYRLTQSQKFLSSDDKSTTPNIHSTYGLGYIVIPYWTDVTDWVTVCDPNNIPTIEVGFYQGKEQPEMFIQDMPNVGSVFNADKITYKIRFIYGLCILDYVGMNKQEVAG